MRLNEKNVVFFSTCNSPVDKEGHLQKRGEVNKGFQKRWFLLKGNLLYYFEKKGDREPVGLIILEGCTVELAEMYTDTYTFQIKFQGPGSRIYYLTAESQGEMEGWMKAIACANYEYMKLMVSELQRQLDEITAAEHANLLAHRNSTANSTAASDIASLISFEDTRRTPSAQPEHGARFNPFNTVQSGELDAFGAPVFNPTRSAHPPPRPPLPKIRAEPSEQQPISVMIKGGKPKNFQELHDFYGAMIQKKVAEKMEKNLLSP